MTIVAFTCLFLGFCWGYIIGLEKGFENGKQESDNLIHKHFQAQAQTTIEEEDFPL